VRVIELGDEKSSRPTSVSVALVCGAGFALGVLTAFAQAWLPHEMGSLANSSGSWALVALLLALLANDRIAAAMFGFLALISLLGGYVVGSEVRDIASSSGLIAFWGLAAVIVGPILGLCAHSIETDHGYWAAIGTGVVSGVLIGEGIYGLRYIADTTYPPYWWVEIAVGVALLGWVVVRRVRGTWPAVLALASSLVVAAAFVAIYSQDLISLFP
jgi:Family of unknown function (DUF6518)